MVDAKGLEAAAKATFAKANEGNLKPETIESLWPSQHLPHWSGLAEAAITAYLEAVGYGSGWRAKAADDVLAERRRQVEAEGWTPEHDDEHNNGEMAIAAACYALNATDDSDGPEIRFVGAELWPWADEWWKPTNPRRDLVKAAALILAEIERIDRIPAAPQHGGE